MKITGNTNKAARKAARRYIRASRAGGQIWWVGTYQKICGRRVGRI
jgi:hypothetical protein